LYENDDEGYDMPALFIRFNDEGETEKFYSMIHNEFNRDPLYLSTTKNAASKHKKKNKRKSKKRKSKKRKSKKRKSKKRKSKKRKSKKK
jgi:hypothetical protein